MEEFVHRTRMLLLLSKVNRGNNSRAKVNRGHNSRAEKVVKSEIEIGIPLMLSDLMYKFQS
jgi:hypothetical protein